MRLFNTEPKSESEQPESKHDKTKPSAGATLAAMLGLNQNNSDCGICDGINQWAKNAQKKAFIHHTEAQQEVLEKGTAATPTPYMPFTCPPNSAQLGRQAWAFLHTMAAYFPEKPSAHQQASAKQFFYLLSDLYPCHVCAEHLKDELQVHPPITDSNASLSLWLCNIHNQVNEMLGKPIFDCSRVFERWRTGPKDHACLPFSLFSTLTQPPTNSHPSQHE